VEEKFAGPGTLQAAISLHEGFLRPGRRERMVPPQRWRRTCRTADWCRRTSCSECSMSSSDTRAITPGRVRRAVCGGLSWRQRKGDHSNRKKRPKMKPGWHPNSQSLRPRNTAEEEVEPAPHGDQVRRSGDAVWPLRVGCLGMARVRRSSGSRFGQGLALFERNARGLCMSGFGLKRGMYAIAATDMPAIGMTRRS